MAQFHPVLHQHFIDVFDALPVDDFRTSAGIPQDATLFVSFGYIKPYKQTAKLIGAFIEAAIPNSYLVIAGRVQKSYRDVVFEAAQNNPNIRIIDRALENAELADIVREADARVFNFSGQFNSGSLIASLSMNTPVVCPVFPAFDELAEVVGPDWMLGTPALLGAEDLALAGRRFSRNLRCTKPDLSHLSPEAVAQRHQVAYGLDSQ